jgi:hypothetical protein
VALLPAAPGWAAFLLVVRVAPGSVGRPARLVTLVLPAAWLVAVVHQLCPVTVAAFVLPQAIAPDVAIRAMAMAGNTDAPQLIPPALSPPGMAMATRIAMTATAVTALTAPGGTGTLSCVTRSKSGAQSKKAESSCYWH